MTNPPTVALKRNARFYTLGCKVNQYETQAIRESFARKGIRDAEGDREALCDFVILNTCTVTEKADKTSRYWIRRLRREHPGACLVVTGCYVEKNRKEIEAMPEVDLIFTNAEKTMIAESLIEGRTREGNENSEKSALFAPLFISKSEGRTRAYVKIQDGCNHVCSFCKVVLVRGRSRSRALSDIKEELLRLRDGGYHEVILTGIQLGAYGRDLDVSLPSGGGESALLEVIEYCARVEGIERIRLSSMELTDLTEPIRDAFQKTPKLCPHLHIPLQSGDNGVLQRMNRRYSREMYRDVVLKLKENVPDFSLSIDVMAGFPEETEEQFQNTMELLKLVKPLKSHVFPYSRREGTCAAAWESLALPTVRDRVRRLIKLTDEISHEIRTGYLGRSFEVLAEHRDEGIGLWEGHTANFLKVFFKCSQNVQGCMIPIHLNEFFRDGFLGTVQKVGRE